MRDELRMYAAPEAFTPLRRCEWCKSPALRGGDLCGYCLSRHTSTLDALYDAAEVAAPPELSAETFIAAIRTIGGNF